MMQFRTGPNVTASVLFYGLYAVVQFVGLFWEILLIPGYYLWPFPFLLLVQRFVDNPAGPWVWTAALVLGFVPIVMYASLVQKRFGSTRPNVLLAWLLAVPLCAVSLAVLTGAAYLLARFFGWPMGF